MRTTTGVVRRVVAGRAIRGFADGFVSILLVRHLDGLGFSPLAIGGIVTATLVGSAALTLAAGLVAHRMAAPRVLVAASGLMVATGVGFAGLQDFWPLLLVALLGTLNPSAGDVSVFLPTEQAYLAGQVGTRDRPRTYATYNLAGTLAGAAGALVSTVPVALGAALGASEATSLRMAFVVYAVAALVLLVVYRGLGDAPAAGSEPSTRGLHASRGIVLRLAALFSLDSAASGFVVQSLLVLWLHLRFELSAGAVGAVFFAAGLLGAASQFLAGRLAARIGLVRTMVFTHLPANLLLAAAAFAPVSGVAIGLLLARSLCASMDQPARQAFVMAVVRPEERAAAASITNVPRSLASAVTPLLAGYLLSKSDIGWPLLIAGAGKVAYDVLLLRSFRDVELPEEVAADVSGPV